MRNAERLVIRDRAGCMGLLGLMFFSGGVLVLTMLLLGKLGPERRTWEILAVTAIGLAHFTVGGWLLASTPGRRVLLRRDRPVLELRKNWLTLRRIRAIHLDEMAGFHVHTTTDSDGDPVFYLELDLRNGETIRLHSVAVHARPEIDAAAERLRAWSNGRLVARIRTPRDSAY
jgi:hypothetical protein